MTHGPATTVRDLGEKRIIEEIIKPICGPSNVRLGIGDDAAMLAVPFGKSLVVSTDKIPEDLLAVQLGLMDAFHHGRYLATLNISDIAAMGGEPAGLLVTLALPEDFSADYLADFYRGLAAGCSEWNCSVIGGDLGWGGSVCMSATSLGFVDPDMVLKRSGAQIGDSVFVTGTIGAFNTALLYFIVAKPQGLVVNEMDELFLKEKLVRPVAQVRKGLALAASRLCTSCMDITDGVGRAIFEFTRASNVSVVIEEDALPLHPTAAKVATFLQMEVYDVVFGMGLDLQLMGTVRVRAGKLPSILSDEIYIVGSVVEQGTNALRTHEGALVEIPQRGWEHFTGKAMEVVKECAARRPS